MTTTPNPVTGVLVARTEPLPAAQEWFHVGKWGRAGHGWWPGPMVGVLMLAPVQVVVGLAPEGTVTPAGRLSVTEIPTAGWEVGL